MIISFYKTSTALLRYAVLHYSAVGCHLCGDREASIYCQYTHTWEDVFVQIDSAGGCWDCLVKQRAGTQVYIPPPPVVIVESLLLNAGQKVGGIHWMPAELAADLINATTRLSNEQIAHLVARFPSTNVAYWRDIDAAYWNAIRGYGWGA